MELNDILVIIALIVGPIMAVIIQRWRDNQNLKRERRMSVFRALMKTRASPLSPLHVEALNMIDIEFYKESEVIDAWKSLLYNFTQYPSENADDFKIKLEASRKKSNELLIVLLSKMAKSLKYKFNDAQLQRDVYTPLGHAEIESKQRFLLDQFTEILEGKKAFPIKIMNSDITKSAHRKSKQWKIIKAIYYSTKSTDKAIDVTNNLINAIKDNRLRITVNNDIAGDPDPGISKKLKIEYMVNGKKIISEFDERTEIDLP